MNCNVNGKTYVNYCTPAAGGTAASASYMLSLTHYLCGDKEMCINNGEGLPSISVLNSQVLNAPRLLGNGQYCCDVSFMCDLTYREVYKCGCSNPCPQNERFTANYCLLLTSDTVPTVTVNGALVDPVGECCASQKTNEVSVFISFTVATE